MIIKSLTLHGFKSFSDKSEFVFSPGITAVIGPNGCGKSNVVDAVRFVLGESNARILRGSRMEDLVFAGSQSKRGQGYGEVSLILDNSDKSLNLDFAEVKVRRRVYKSGESEYYLNDSPCRLKDIQELFRDTGVGREGYSVIGQGRIEDILNEKPEGRRAVFEEAAGIVKVRLRKKEAEQKLAETRLKMERLDETLLDMEERLGPLSEQAQKAEAYQAAAARLRNAEIVYYTDFLRDIGDKKQAVEAARKAVEDKLQALQNETELKELNLEENRAQRALMEAEGEKLREDYFAYLNHIEGLSQKLETLKARQEMLLEQKRQDEEAGKTEEEKLAAREEDLLIAREDLAAVEEAIRELQEDLGRRDELLLKSREEADGLIQKRTEAQKEAYRLREEEISHKNRLTHWELVLENSLKEARRIKERRSREEGRKAELADKLSLYEGEVKKLSARQAALENDIRAVRETEDKRTEQIKTLQLQMDEKKREDLGLAVRIDALKRMEKAREGYQFGVRNFFQLAEKETNFMTRVHGTVLDLFTAEESREKAVMAALGAAGQNIVVDDEKTALDAISLLKRSGKGRATFLPLSAERGGGMAAAEIQRLKKAPGFVALADEAITTREEYKPLFQYLLGRTAIFDTAEKAVNYAKATGYKTRLVSLDGDMVMPGGIITGGSRTEVRSDLISRGRELKELTEKSDRLKAEGKLLQEKMDNLSADTGNQTELNRLTEELSALQAHWQEREGERRLIANQVEEIGRSMLLFDADEEGRKVEEERAEEAFHTEQAALNLAETARKAADDALAAVTRAVEELEQKLSAQGESYTELRIDLAAQEETRKFLSEEVQEEEAAILAERQALQNRRDTMVQREERYRELLAEEQALLAEQNGADAVKAEKNKALDDHKNAVRLLDEGAQALDADIRRIDSDIRRENQAADRITAEWNRVSVQYETYLNRLWDKHRLTFDRAMKIDMDRSVFDGVKKPENLLKKLEEEVDAFGEVNLGAIEEYRQSSEKYTFFKTQREDLLKAELSMGQMLKEIETKMAERFKEAFDLINIRFDETFRAVFKGGRASLRLTDENDLLNAGIEIDAEPPGKKLQNLTLLSGGEKALTALALLFAIIRTKNTPFCVLDEIDAPLDDYNVTRFAEYLGSIKTNSQFIIITHRNGSMEAADMLYGVTMGGTGVSKVVSLELSGRTKKDEE